eukprot:scaffold1700_cov106-Isochrysis_galbana.AAC.1
MPVGLGRGGRGKGWKRSPVGKGAAMPGLICVPLSGGQAAARARGRSAQTASAAARTRAGSGRTQPAWRSRPRRR